VACLALQAVAMPPYAILVREYFPPQIMGTVFGVVAMISKSGMALGPPVGGWLFDHFGGYGWLYVASSAIGVAGALIAMTVRPHRPVPAALSAAGLIGLTDVQDAGFTTSDP
jgi:MFS family permease